MGACTFECEAIGKSAAEAFSNAVEEAKYNYGHAGYTGTIAEKWNFVMIDLPEGREIGEYADELIRNDDRRVSDKWGPAGCIKMEEGRYYFFGWASE